MTFPILGGNGAVGGYEIANSLRFNDDDSARLENTFGSAGDRTAWTWSGWVKIGNISTAKTLFGAHIGGSYLTFLQITSSNEIRYYDDIGTDKDIKTNRLFRDTSAFYHIVLQYDSDNATSSDRVKIYINGERETSFATSSYPTLGEESRINTAITHRIGSHEAGSYMDGYIAEVHFIDGQALTPTDFGEFDEDSGIWKPKAYEGTYTGNSFYLDFENSGSLGADVSGLGNNFTPTNLASTDQTTDTPTNNFATILPMANTSLSEGNLKLTTSRTGNWDGTIGTFGVKSGKWYHEVRMSNTEETFRCVAGWIGNEASQTVVLNGKGTSIDPVSSLFDNYAFLSWTTPYYKDGTYNGTSPTASSGDIINIAVDFDNGKIWFGINGTYYDSTGSATGNPSAGTNESISGIDLTASEYVPFFQIRSDSSIGGNIMIPNFGQEGSFAGTETAQGNADENGYGDFYYAPPSGYLALCTQNLATVLSPTIDDGSAYFHTQLYTGTGSTNAVTNDANAGDFQPDWLWIKNRSATSNHYIIDSNRGDFVLYSNLTNSEDSAGYFESFDTDGFTVSGNTANANASGNNFTAWQWKANAGSTSSNTDGSITSTVQANTTAGFSIVTYTGTGANATIGHSLGKVPKMIIVKRRNSTSNWGGYHESIGNTSTIKLNSTDASAPNIVFWNNTSPTSSVFTVGTSTDLNASGGTYVAYCFAEIEGYSKMGKYTGNNSTDGAFVYTGFRPAWLLVKKSDGIEPWQLRDTTREPFNVTDLRIDANSSNAEGGGTAGDQLDIFSNGFKCRSGAGQFNGNNTYIYIAFAENPFVTSTGIPVTAR